MVIGKGMKCQSCGMFVVVNVAHLTDSFATVLAPDGSLSINASPEQKTRIEEALESGSLVAYCLARCGGVRGIISLPVAGSWPPPPVLWGPA